MYCNKLKLLSFLNWDRLNQICSINILTYSGWAVISALCVGQVFASDTGQFDDVYYFDRYGTKLVILSSDTLAAIETAKSEAQKHNVQFSKITRYSVAFNKDRLVVSLLPPYEGGLDGPEFRVEISRINLKVLSIKDSLGVR